MNAIQIPLKMRVWAAVRNRPGSTVNEIMAYIKTDRRSSISSALTVLEFNEVVYSTGDSKNVSAKRYFTELEVYDPVQASHHNYRKSVMNLKLPSTKPVVKSPKPIEVVPVASSDKIEALFDTLTLNECRDLYQRLHTIFG